MLWKPEELVWAIAAYSCFILHGEKSNALLDPDSQSSFVLDIIADFLELLSETQLSVLL